ncbi:MAG: outer membrane protein assembly factor BamB family protein [Acidimicrobiia bacterium]
MRRVGKISIAVVACIVLGAALVGVVGAGADHGAHPRVGRAAAKSVPGDPMRATRVRVEWSEPVRGWPSQLAADGNGVVAVSGGRFVSLFASSDGSRHWETEVPGPLHPFMEPAIDARSVLVSARDRFIALDRSGGAIRWEVPAATGAETADGAGGVALVPSADGKAVALTAGSGGTLTGRDPATGSAQWSIVHDGVVDAHLAGDPATGCAVAVWRTRAEATVRAIDVITGALRWEHGVEPMVASPVVAGDAVIVAAGDGDYTASIRAMALADGTIRWRTPVPASFEPDQVPGVADATTRAGVVGVQDHLGTVSLFDLRTGTLRWRTETRVPALGGRVVLTTDAVVVRNEGRQLVILDRPGGGIRARRKDPEGLPEGIASVGDRVLVGWRWTQPGRIDALEIEIARSGPE